MPRLKIRATMWSLWRTGWTISIMALLLLGWSAADGVPFSAQKPNSLSAAGDPYNAGAAASGSGSKKTGQYQLHLVPLPSAAATTLQLETLVFAIATHSKKEANVFAGRPVRLGLPTYVVTDHSTDGPEYEQNFQMHKELWEFYRDDQPLRSFYPGDSRAAIAPFLAYRAFQRRGIAFRWLFNLDDDTIVFPHAVLRLGARLDADMPYFLSDNTWFNGDGGKLIHPHDKAPRCLPCNFGGSLAHVPSGMVPGCPCTPSDICQLEATVSGKGLLNDSAGYCGFPRPPAVTYSFHGGAGLLISEGLLKAIPFEPMEACVQSQWMSGGDAFLTGCLWEAGYVQTDPDPLYKKHNQDVMFDPAPAGLDPDEQILDKAGMVLGNLFQVAADSCTGLCKRQFDHTMSTHLRCRRVHEDPNACAAMLLALSQLYAKIVYPSIAAQLPGPAPGALYGELASFCKVEYLMQRSIDVVKLLSNASAGEAADEERKALAPATAFVGSQTLHGLKGDLDKVVAGFKEKNLAQSQ